MTIVNPQCVLVPVDFSEASFNAVGTALEMCDSPDKVHTIYVIPAPETEADFLRQAITKESRGHALSELKEKLAKHGYAKVNPMVREGIPSDEISAAAEQLKADIILIPSHSRSGLPRLFLGSVTNQVLRSAPCPVLVIRRN